jgi:Superinfection immunity protein
MTGITGILVTTVVFALVIGAYVLPALVAFIRHVPNTGSVVVINVLLGWTFIGWVVALAMALRSVPGPAVQVIGHQAVYGRPPADPRDSAGDVR